MKTRLIILAALLLLFLLSCSRDDSDVLANRIDSGTWKITYFYDKDHDETSDYSGMSFSFGDDGTVNAVTSSATYNGTWSTGNDDSASKFYLNFSSPDALIEISEDWVILNQSNSKIELEDDSDNGTELLTFEKN
mgnify:FL=1